MTLDSILKARNINPANLAFANEKHNGESESFELFFDDFAGNTRNILKFNWYHTFTRQPRKDSDLAIDFVTYYGWNEKKGRWGDAGERQQSEQRITIFKAPENKKVIKAVIAEVQKLIAERLDLVHSHSTAAYKTYNPK